MSTCYRRKSTYFYLKIDIQHVKEQPMKSIRFTKSEIGFTVFLLLFCFLFVFVEMANSKLWTNDFRVYYGAVHEFFSGKNPYVDNY
jgi:hypothetical protein